MTGNQPQSPAKLLAESRRNHRELSLEQHLRDTEDAAWLPTRLSMANGDLRRRRHAF
jgi:hypothetical protein